MVVVVEGHAAFWSPFVERFDCTLLEFGESLLF